jgi:membrane associated rhomboid family serine protease
MKFLVDTMIFLFIFLVTPIHAHRTYNSGLPENLLPINNRKIAVSNRRSNDRNYREISLINQRRKKSTARFYMIPRQSQMRPNERGSSWSNRILFVNVVVFALQCFYPSLTKWGIKLSDKIMKGEDMYRLVSPMFLHGGIAHLMTNCYSLSAVGPDVERYFGSGRFLATYLMSGIAGNYLSAIRSPNPSLGASGAVFGIVGAYFTFLIQNEDLFGRQGDYMQRNLAQTIMVNLVMGAVSPMIDQWGHVGGFLGGIGMAATFGPRLRMVSLPFGESALIDEPLLRLPRHIESIPEQISDRFEKIKRRIQVNSYLADLPSKPWRQKRPQQFQRQVAPNRSIKPLPVK